MIVSMIQSLSLCYCDPVRSSFIFKMSTLHKIFATEPLSDAVCTRNHANFYPYSRY